MTVKTISNLLALGAAVAAAPSLLERQATSLDAYIARERDISVQGILRNTGPNAVNTLSGVILAAPGITNPDYRYSWTRDAALTAHALDEEFFVGNSSLQSTLEDYIHAEAIRQTVTTPLGSLVPWGTTLGEPKFWPNLTRFNGVWGRPQPDGPALRAVTLMDYIEYLLHKNQEETAKNVIWPIVQNDLNYVSQYWSVIGYDLWEEVAGVSFFTIQSQWRALNQGTRVAKQLGLQCANCEDQAPEIACFLANKFWNETGHHVTANVNTPTPSTRSGLDVAALLSAIQNFDIDGSCDNSQYQPCSSRILATHKVYVDAFRDLYAVNDGIAANAAIATGRYPEDTYYGGNPWYLTTLSAAETLYDAAAQFRRQGQLTIDSLSLPFFKQIYPSAKLGTYHAPKGYHSGKKGYHWGGSGFGEITWGYPSSWGKGRPSNDFSKIIHAMTTYADGFFGIIEKYTPANGSLSEEFNRTTGEQLSAYDLTWSFAAFVTASQRRAGQFPASWQSRKAAAPSSGLCSTSGVARASYAPATAAGAPAIDTSCTVQVKFYVNATTSFGQNIFVTGSVPALGNWAPGYEPMVTPFYPIWQATIDVKPNQVINYKYVYQNTANYALEARNRTLTVGTCGDGYRSIEVHDVIGATGPVVTAGFCNPDVTRCEDTSYLS